MKPVEIYTSPLCGYSSIAKRLLASKGVEIAETILLWQPDKRREMVTRAGGRTSVPQIFIDGAHVGGCMELLALDERGELDGSYQGSLIMTYRDRVCSSSGRRKPAGDAGHRQGFSTPADGLHRRPVRRLSKAFGRRRVRLAMPCIAATNAPSRKPWKAVSMGHY